MPATTTELTGVFVNGQIVPDARPLPDGTRVRFEVVGKVAAPAEVGELADEDEDCPPMPEEPADRATEIELLRQSIADAKAGIGLVTHEQFMAELAAEFGFTYPFRKE